MSAESKCICGHEAMEHEWSYGCTNNAAGDGCWCLEYTRKAFIRGMAKGAFWAHLIFAVILAWTLAFLEAFK